MSLLPKKEAVEKHWQLLRERLEPDFDLPDLLLSRLVISNEEKVRIMKAGSTFYDRNDALIDRMKQSEADKFDKFCQALRDALPTQIHLVNFLEKDGDRSQHADHIWPLENKQIEVLDVNVSSLKSLIFTKPVVNVLLEKEVISAEQTKYILSKGTDFTMNEELLQIIRKRSLRDYDEFTEALDLIKCNAAAEILRGGACLEVTTKLSNESHEIGLVEKLKQLVKGDVSSETLLRSELITLLSQYEVVLIEAVPKRSIVLYFLCKSLKGLQFLGDSDRLERQIESMYNSLLPEPVTVEIKWNKDDFDRCEKYLSKLEAEKNLGSKNDEKQSVAESKKRTFECAYPSSPSVSRNRSLPAEPSQKIIKIEGKSRRKTSDSFECSSQKTDIAMLTGSKQLVTVEAKVLCVEDGMTSSFCAEIQDKSAKTKITANKPEDVRKCREQLKEKKCYFFRNFRDVKSNVKFQRLGHHDSELSFVPGSTILPTKPSKTTTEFEVIALANLKQYLGRLVNVQVLVRRSLRIYEKDDVPEGEVCWIVCDQSGKETRLQMTKQKPEHDEIHVNDVLDLKSVRVKLQNHRIDIVSNLGHYSKVNPNSRISRVLRRWIDDNKRGIVPIFEDPCTCDSYDQIQSVDGGISSFRIEAVVKEVHCDEFMACKDCGTRLERPECSFCKIPETKAQKTSYLKFRSEAFDDSLIIYVMNEGDRFELETFSNRKVMFTLVPCQSKDFDGFRCLEFKLSEEPEHKQSQDPLPGPAALPVVLSTL